jgi:hypothetical protein
MKHYIYGVEEIRPGYYSQQLCGTGRVGDEYEVHLRFEGDDKNAENLPPYTYWWEIYDFENIDYEVVDW